jgi:hypothetical protein
VRLGATVFLLDTLFAFIILLYLGLTSGAYAAAPFIVFLLGLHTGKYIVLLIFGGRVFANWGTAYYDICEGQLIVARGIVQVTEDHFDLSALGEIEVNQDWLGRWLGYGHLVIQMRPATAGQAIILSDVRTPQHYAQLITRARSELAASTRV